MDEPGKGKWLQSPGKSGEWGKGDVITVRVDLINWEITFEKNGQINGKPQAIKKRAVYFPAVQMCQCAGCDFEIIDN